MDGLTNITNQQQTQTASINNEKVQETEHIEHNLVKEAQEESKDINIESKSDVEDLVKQLNEAVSPMDTNLKFGVDKDNVYFVSVIDQKTNDVIRRFPAEKGIEILPKMQEVSGILFDLKG